MQIFKLADYRKIYVVEGFEEEFDSVVKETNINGRYHKWLRRKLNVLDARGYGVLQDRDFEPLTGCNPKLYALRYPKSPVNPRVVYVYVGDGAVYLLHTFKESSKNSSSDYRSGIKVATNRLKLIEE